VSQLIFFDLDLCFLGHYGFKKHEAIAHCVKVVGGLAQVVDPHAGVGYHGVGLLATYAQTPAASPHLSPSRSNGRNGPTNSGADRLACCSDSVRVTLSAGLVFWYTCRFISAAIYRKLVWSVLVTW
jgi:hypothetical protein